MLNGRGVDMDAWDRVGRRLGESDRSRFESVLELAERIVRLHEDPVSATLAEPYVPPDDQS
jgi:hypothetical protein